MTLQFWKNIKLKGESSWMNRITWIIAEFFGATMFMFLGCLGTTLFRSTLVILEMPLAFGQAFMTAMQCFGHISGAHINPLVTISAILTGRVSLLDSLFYFLGEFLGSFFGYGYAMLVLPEEHRVNPLQSNPPGFCTGVINPGLSKVQALFVEFFISFIFAMVACGVWHYENKTKFESVYLRFGLALLGLTIAAGPFTGAHMNPARTLAPAMLNNYWDDIYLYWGGQLLGGTLGAIVYILIFYEDTGGGGEEAKTEEA